MKCLKCQLDAIFSEDYCWEHLTSEDKASHKKKILNLARQGYQFINCNFEKVDLSGIKFPESSVFRACLFRGANLRGTQLKKADLKESDFTMAGLQEANLEQADFRGTRTVLRSANIKEANLSGASLQNADLTGADLQDALLVDVDFIGAKLKNVHFYASRLSNTRFRKECLVNFENIHPMKISIADEQANWENCYNTPLLARFVYSSMKVNFYALGEFDDARWAHIKERIMERKRLFSLGFEHNRCADSIALEHWDGDDKLYESTRIAKWKWLSSYFAWILTGYGERPSHLLYFCLAVMGGFSILFHIVGNTDFTNSLALSAISFTTLGFLPQTSALVNETSLLAGTEALMGSVLLALYAAMIGHRFMRS